jgi:hypothetical protein
MTTGRPSRGAGVAAAEQPRAGANSDAEGRTPLTPGTEPSESVREIGDTAGRAACGRVTTGW